MDNSQTSRARKIPAATWESHRQTIEMMHQTKKLEGADGIIASMIDAHDFQASKSQYETQFKKWGFRKYLKRKELHDILSVVEDRKCQGKRTIGQVGRIFKSEEQLERELARHLPSLSKRARTSAFDTQISKTVQSGPTPLLESLGAQSSEPIVVYTPPASPNASVADQVSGLGTHFQLFDQDLNSDVAIDASSLQVAQWANQHSFEIPWTGCAPFSWTSSLDWNLLKNFTKENQSLIKYLDPKGSIDESLFYPNRQIAKVGSEPEADVVFAQHLVTLLLNDMSSSRQTDLEKVHAWLRKLPHPTILQFFKALPSGHSDILRERVFIAALEAGDETTIKMILQLGFDVTQKIKISGSESSPALPLCKALRWSQYSIARVIVEHLCNLRAVQSPGHLDYQLNQVFYYSNSISSYILASDDSWFLIVRMLLGAGATPPNDSLVSRLAMTNTELLIQLLQHLQNTRVGAMNYIRRVVLQKCFLQTTRTAYRKTILSYFIPREVLSTPKQHLATKSVLWDALKAASEVYDSSAVDDILDTALSLDMELGNHHWDWDATTHSAFITACRKKDWTIIEQAFPDSLLSRKSAIVKAINDTLEAAKQVRQKDLFQSVPVDHDLVDRILRDKMPFEDENDPHDMIDRAVSLGCDELAVALFSYLDLVELCSKPMLKLLEEVKVAIISRVLCKCPPWVAALEAFSSHRDSGPLEDLVFRADFLVTQTSRQIALRVLAYLAINSRDYSLLWWILESGLSTCAIRVGIYEDAFDEPFVTKCLYSENQAYCSFDTEFLLRSLLDVAVSQKDGPIVQFFMKQGACSGRSSSLMLAVLAGADDHLVDNLLPASNEEQAHYGRNFGASALRAAIFRKNYQRLRYLSSRVDINGVDELFIQSSEADLFCHFSLSPLGEAILRRDDAAAEILIHHHADLNGLIAFEDCPDSRGINKRGSVLYRKSPLLAAVDSEYMPMVRLLVENGAEVDHAPRLGLMRTPIQRAAEIGNFEIVQYLLTHKDSIDAAPCLHGGTALQLAALQGHVGIATLLIEHGADVNHLPARGAGRTALEGAAEWSRPDMMSLLVSKGVNFDLVVDNEGNTQYERALQFAEKNGKPASKRFLERLRNESEIISFTI